jgi:large subunit ribosomal protein L1
MANVSKRQQAINAKLTANKSYTAPEAIALLQELPLVKFVEGVDVAVILGVDVRKSDQTVRGGVVLPHGTGKTVRVAVFTTAAHADAALKAGADIVGLEDLAEKVKAGEMNFDIVVATPDAMRVVGQLGQVLGPRGLMPNPKEGTVTMDVATAVKNAKSGQVRYRADKAGIVHCTIGKINFSANNLLDNLNTVLQALKKARPATAKGVYFKKITISSTMGPGLRLDVSGLAV